MQSCFHSRSHISGLGDSHIPVNVPVHLNRLPLVATYPSSQMRTAEDPYAVPVLNTSPLGMDGRVVQVISVRNWEKEPLLNNLYDTYINHGLALRTTAFSSSIPSCASTSAHTISDERESCVTIISYSMSYFHSRISEVPISNFFRISTCNCYTYYAE